MKNVIRVIVLTVIFTVLSQCLAPSLTAYAQQDTSQLKFNIVFPEKSDNQSFTGRLYLIITTKTDPEPRLQIGGWKNGPPVFAMDVSGVKPGGSVAITDSVLGYPLRSLRELPANEYYIQALFNIYTEFHRSDGFVIWAHMDQWEGQKFNRSPGNLVSHVQKVYIDPSTGYTGKLSLNKKIPPIEVPKDTKWVKRIKIKSELLTKFWGHPIYLGATVLLPKGYDTNSDVHYPVEYIQDHFNLRAPHNFRTDNPLTNESERFDRQRNHNQDGYDFYQEWISDDFPRMICVTFQHPTPYYDDSYAVNSANNGPYGDAIITELIPYIENQFRIISKPYARVLSGGSTGGWEALALQVFHPDFFSGAWVFYPDQVDFRRYGLINIYDDNNAFSFKEGEWRTIERPMHHSTSGQPKNTIREVSWFESVLGSKRRSGQQLAIWEATFGPVGKDGYPKPLWDSVTGEIDHSVSDYMKEKNYDLRHYMETNWSTLGPKLQGKLRFYCGDMDDWYLNLGVYLLEDFLEGTQDPYYEGSFEYGRPMKGHGWRPMFNSELINMMSQHILNRMPASEKPPKWIYNE